MEDLTSKFSKCWVITMLMRSYGQPLYKYYLSKSHMHIPLGIAKKAIGITEFLCARLSPL